MCLLPREDGWSDCLFKCHNEPRHLTIGIVHFACERSSPQFHLVVTHTVDGKTFNSGQANCGTFNYCRRPLPHTTHYHLIKHHWQEPWLLLRTPKKNFVMNLILRTVRYPFASKQCCKSMAHHPTDRISPARQNKMMCTSDAAPYIL